jgi:hypothetical protein
MKQRGELAYESDAESDQDDADEGMRSDTEANTEHEANGTGGETRRRRWEKGGNGSAMQGQWKALARSGTWHRMVMAGQPPLGAPPPLSGGGAGGGGGGVGWRGGELAAGGVQAKADHAVT